MRISVELDILTYEKVGTMRNHMMLPNRNLIRTVPCIQENGLLTPHFVQLGETLDDLNSEPFELRSKCVRSL